MPEVIVHVRQKHLYAPIGALFTKYSFKPIGAYKCFLKPDVYDNLAHAKWRIYLRGKIWPMRALEIVTSGRFCAS